ALPKRFEQRRDSAIRRFEQLKRTENEAISAIEREEGKRPESIKDEQSEIEAEFDGLRKQSDQIIKSRDGTGDSELSRRIKKLFDARDLLSNYQKVHASVKRIRRAWECLNSGAYKDWV
ncbi:MAG: hypothetical protein NT084_15135, partial [Bacteroidetes bacterium]|nr:hypothetical protein [Bacteroidota bacterium]